MSYNGGADTDSLTLVGTGSGAASYQPSAIAGSGTLAIAGSAVAFAGIEPVTASGFASLTIVTPAASDTLFIDKPAANQNRISSFSHGTPLSPLLNYHISQVLIDTAAND